MKMTEKRAYVRKVLKKMEKDGFLGRLGVTVFLNCSSYLYGKSKKRHSVGTFYWFVHFTGRNLNRTPCITVAACRRRWKDTLFHEFAHYEQWKNGKKLTERGVERRGRTLRRMYG